MIIIQKQSEIIDNLLGFQSKSSQVSYRPLHYLINKHISDGVLVYNVMTKCVVLVEEESFEEFIQSKFAIENWFSVPENFDEMTVVLQLRNFGNLLYNKGSNITNYKILTTTDCNARCFYCYEKGVARFSMTFEIAEKVVQFIKNNHDGKHIAIHWFGGEPLYNVKVIDYICSELFKHNIDFDTDMISNAYLFDDAMIHKAKTLWNLKKVQITLDGTEKKYNKIKHYIHEDNNPFLRVIHNIDILLKNEILVHLRLNVDKYNISNMGELVDYIIHHFKGATNLYVYLIQLYENIGHAAIHRTDEERSCLYKEMDILEEKLNKEGFKSRGKRLPTRLRYNSCMADLRSSIMILPSGKFGRCEHYLDSLYCGDLEQGLIKDSNYLFYEKSNDFEPQCRFCAHFPDCFSLKVCNKMRPCPKSLQRFIVRKEMMRLQNTYNDFIHKKKQDIIENGIELQC